MKRTVLMIGWLMAAVSSRAAVIASDDFSGGTIGTELNGVAVQNGSGTWTKSYSEGYTGNMSPLVFSTLGAEASSGSTGGNAAIEDNYSLYKTVQVSTVFSVGSSRVNNPNVTVGFYETINKGLLQNISADDVVACRLLTGGPNEGKFVWNIRDEGVAMDTSYEGGVVAFSENDVIRLTLSYNPQTGAVTAEAYNITQGSVVNAGTSTVFGVNGFNYAAIGVSGVIADAANPFCFDSVQVDGDARPLDGIIASDDFTDGTNGAAILGAVQSGVGAWVDTALNPVLVVGPDGAMVATNGVSSGGLALQDDYAVHTNKLSVSTVFSVRENKPTNPNVYIGFVETIDKSTLQNVTAGDVVGVRMLTSGANEGKLIWNIRDEGTSVSTVYNGDQVSFGSNDLICLTLTCDFPAGSVSAEAYNLTQDSVINTADITFTNDISGFNYTGVGLLYANPTGLANPAYFQRVDVMADSGRFTVPVLTVSGAAASTINLSASNLTLSSGWTNYLQAAEILSNPVSWSNLYTVTGTAETNWTISADSDAKFFRIQTSQE